MDPSRSSSPATRSRGGAKAHTGAKHDGQIYYPTILADVPLDGAIANEETFGPVVVVEAVDTPEDAIAAANRTMHCLTSSILAGNTCKAFEMGLKVLAGIVNVNSPAVYDEIHAPMVADASVMPQIITGPTNAPTHMIAGRAAKLILQVGSPSLRKQSRDCTRLHR